MKSSISVILFFLLSGFFLSALLGALERSRRLLGLSVACVIAVACVIVFLTPVELPVFNNSGKTPDAPAATTSSTVCPDPGTDPGTGGGGTGGGAPSGGGADTGGAPGSGAPSSTITTTMTGEGVSARSY